MALRALVWVLIILLVSVILVQPARASSSSPTFISSTVGNSQAQVTSHIITLPISSASGDLLISCLGLASNPAVTWPAGWNLLLTQAYSTVDELSCAYRFDDGTLGSTFTVTTGTAQDDSNVTYRIRNAEQNASPVQSAPLAGTGSTLSTNALGSSSSETRMFIAVYTWTAGTTAATSYGAGLNAYTPAFPGISASWNNAAGANILTAYKFAAEDIEGSNTLNLAGSTTGAVRSLFSVKPAAVPASTDYTPTWLLLALFVILLVAGFKLPFIHIFAGLVGVVLAIQLLSTMGAVISTLIAGFGVMLMIAGIFRRG